MPSSKTPESLEQPDPPEPPGVPGDIRGRVKARERDFDVNALLDLLAHLGLYPEATRRVGHPTTAPQPTWLHAVDFRGDAPEITANLGLLSCRSPLPAYFQEVMEDPDVREPLEELLALLDDRLVERRFASYRPERDTSVIPDWAAVKRDVLRLSGLRSPAAMHALFQWVFPELRVTVRRAPQGRRVRTGGVRLGRARLGSAAFGGEAIVPVRGLEVSLLCDERLSPLGDPWIKVAGCRLREQVFPVLAGSGVQLVVALLLLDDEAVARLETDLPPEAWSYTGYDPLGPKPAEPPFAPDKPPRVVLHTGAIPAQAGAR